MREIKFRAWDDYHKIMITPYCELKDGAFWGEDTTNNPIYVKHEHVMQFTGLKDRNGKDIYEGDICKHPDHHFARSIIYNPHDGWLSNFIEGTDVSYIEVIGNIYENPELL